MCPAVCPALDCCHPCDGPLQPRSTVSEHHMEPSSFATENLPSPSLLQDVRSYCSALLVPSNIAILLRISVIVIYTDTSFQPENTKSIVKINK